MERVSVAVGVHYLSSITKRYAVVKSIRYPGYFEFPLVYHDIGLLELNESVTFTNQVRPACLSEVDKLFYNENLYVSGWGVIKEENNQVTDVPMKTVLNQDPHYSCVLDWFGLLSFTSHFCAYHPSSSACYGDSGGPLMNPYAKNKVEVVGIVSFGQNCNSNKPTVFTKVASYNNWIRANAGEYCSHIISISSIPSIPSIPSDLEVDEDYDQSSTISHDLDEGNIDY